VQHSDRARDIVESPPHPAGKVTFGSSQPSYDYGGQAESRRDSPHVCFRIGILRLPTYFKTKLQRERFSSLFSVYAFSHGYSNPMLKPSLSKLNQSKINQRSGTGSSGFGGPYSPRRLSIVYSRCTCTGQRKEQVSTQELQRLLGPDFQVVNSLRAQKNWRRRSLEAM
jgi:hypothetical protein